MPLKNIPSPLAYITCHDKSSCIFEHPRPIKTHLENLCNGLLGTKVSIISGSMANKMFLSCMITEDNDLRVNQVGAKFLQGEDNR